MEFHFIWWMKIKKYYNSISRQSGIVHKDKAMRQLDLDLWEMNWLVAGPAHSTLFISFQLALPNGRAEEIKKELTGSGPLCGVWNWRMKFQQSKGKEQRSNSNSWNEFVGRPTKATQPSINTTKQRHLLFVDDWLVCCLAGPYFHSINQLNLLPFPFQKNSWLIPFQSLHKLGYFNSTW